MLTHYLKSGVIFLFELVMFLPLRVELGTCETFTSLKFLLFPTIQVLSLFKFYSLNHRICQLFPLLGRKSECRGLF